MGPDADDEAADAGAGSPDADDGNADGGEPGVDGRAVDATTVEVAGTPVVGVDVDPETRCAHYDSALDVVAFAFPCCGTVFPCRECHDALADHEASVWPASAFDEPAVLCGACGTRLAIEAYLDSPLTCPACGADFNPGCRAHHDRYFAV